MSEIILLDNSYIGAADAPDFHVGKHVILRKVNDENSFLTSASLREMLVSVGVVPYVPNSYNEVSYLEVEPFYFPNSASNWSYSMYRDSLLLVQSLNEALQKIGYSLIDGHCFNVVFYFSKPVFVDLGSISQGQTNAGMAELANYRKALFSYRTSSAPHTRKRLDSEMEAPCYLDALKDLATPDYFIGWRNKILRICGFDRASRWMHYYGDTPDSYCDLPKEKVVRDIMEKLVPKTVYDIGCNTGHYARIAEAYGADVVACDPDPDCVDSLYLSIKEKNKKILPLVADLDGLVRAVERTYLSLRPSRVDMVFMLALVHHLTYRVGLDFEAVFERVQKLGAESLVIEFVSKKDANVQAWDEQTPFEWYTLKHLCAIGERYYAGYEVFDAHDSERPIVLFYGKRLP